MAEVSFSRRQTVMPDGRVLIDEEKDPQLADASIGIGGASVGPDTALHPYNPQRFGTHRTLTGTYDQHMKDRLAAEIPPPEEGMGQREETEPPPNVLKIEEPSSRPLRRTAA